MGDLQLVRRYSKTKDAEAFAEVVRLYQGMVVATCRRVCFEREDVDDAAQEVFLRMAERAGEIRANVGAWLHRCAVNVARDLNRSRQRQCRREAVVGILAGAVDGDRQTQLAELRECVDAAIERLDGVHRELIAQRFFAGRPQVEMAEAAGVSPATMARRVADAVEALRGELARPGLGIAAISAAELEGWLSAHTGAGAVSAGLAANLAKIGLSGVGKAGGMLSSKACLAAALLLAGGVGTGVWLNGADPAPVAAATRPAATQPAKTASPATTAEISVRRLIYDLRMSPLTSDVGQWGRSLKSLIEIGADAVPEIIAELDRAPTDSQTRAMAFALRAIGDTRAIPALIRALPKTAERTSDFGLSVLDRELWDFMSENEVDPGGSQQYPRFGYARAVRQVNTALETLTGHDIGEKAFFTTDARDAAVSRWEAWWAQNRHRYELAHAYEKPMDGPDTVAEAGREMIFPTGAGVRLGPVIERELEPQGRLDSRAYLDLDTGRVYECLEGYRPKTKEEESECFAHWLPGAGVDATADRSIRVEGGERRGAMTIGGKTIPMGFHLSGSDARGWRVENDTWDRIDTLVSSSELRLPAKAQSDFYPVPFGDGAAGRERATYLFTTREGARGILQTMEHQAEDARFRVRYRLWEGTGKASPGLPAPEVKLGQARFGEERELWLDGPDVGETAGVDFDTGKGLVLPPGVQELPFGAPGDQRIKAYDQMKQWAGENGIDAVTMRDTNGALAGLRMMETSAQEVRPEAWTEMDPAHAADLMQRKLPQSSSPGMIAGKELQTYVVRTNTGLLAIARIVVSGKPERVHVRYRMATSPN